MGRRVSVDPTGMTQAARSASRIGHDVSSLAGQIGSVPIPPEAKGDIAGRLGAIAGEVRRAGGAVSSASPWLLARATWAGRFAQTWPTPSMFGIGAPELASPFPPVVRRPDQGDGVIDGIKDLLSGMGKMAAAGSAIQKNPLVLLKRHSDDPTEQLAIDYRNGEVWAIKHPDKFLHAVTDDLTARKDWEAGNHAYATGKRVVTIASLLMPWLKLGEVGRVAEAGNAGVRGARTEEAVARDVLRTRERQAAVMPGGPAVVGRARGVSPTTLQNGPLRRAVQRANTEAEHARGRLDKAAAQVDEQIVQRRKDIAAAVGAHTRESGVEMIKDQGKGGVKVAGDHATDERQDREQSGRHR